MSRWIAFSSLLVVTALFWGCAGGNSLRPYQWHERVLLVFSDRYDEPLAQQARYVREQADGLGDRSLTVIAIVGKAPPSFWHGRPITIGNRALRDEYGAPSGSGLALRLIGKDGGMKWRAHEPTSLDDIYGIIDAMPMRQAAKHEKVRDR